MLFEGTDLATLDDDALTRWRRANIGFVFQAFHVLPYLTVLQNVALPLDLLGVGDPQRQQPVEEGVHRRHVVGLLQVAVPIDQLQAGLVLEAHPVHRHDGAEVQRHEESL